jgi:ferredoxin-NADP reductase
MAALLTSSGRPGFYFRVLREGEVGAGDDIVKVGEAAERMTVAEINALLYLPPHPRDRLERALRIEALAHGWHGSFEALLQSEQKGAETGNAGLAPAAAAHPASSGFQSLAVTSIDRESADVLSFVMQSADTHQLATALPGQYVVVRLQPTAGGPTLFRSYSLSGPLSTERYRISVKIEPDGAAGNYLHEHLRVGDRLDVSSPRGSFVLQPGDQPIVLLSAGIGATPVLAMLHALAAARSTRQVMWLHTARDGQHHPFAGEVRGLLSALTNARSYVCYTKPDSNDKTGEDFNAAGRFSRSVFAALGLPPDADAYLCGPTQFMADMKAALTAIAVAPERIHIEVFNGGESRTPGVVGATTRTPHPPSEEANSGPLVSFARSGISTHWDAARYASILEMAEACDVPVRWACRTGVCHNCESGLVSGSVVYEPQPLDKPADGNLLVCCSQPASDIVIDL